MKISVYFGRIIALVCVLTFGTLLSAQVPCPTAAELITQSRSPDVVTLGNSMICVNSSNGGAEHFNTSYWRSFEIDSDQILTGVQFGVESSQPGNGISQQIDVQVYLNRAMGFPVLSSLTLMRSHEVEVRAGNGAIMCTGIRPLEVQAGSTVVVEILSPEGLGNLFVVGSNSAGESSPSYISYSPGVVGVSGSSNCPPPMMPTQPTDLANLGLGFMNIVVNLLAETQPSPVPDADGDGVPDACDPDATSGNDCDLNGVLDSCDIDAEGTLDCDGDGQIDTCQIKRDQGLDLDYNNIIDSCEESYFVRGDTNMDGDVDLADATTIIDNLFVAPETTVLCEDAWDTNDDGVVDIADIIVSLDYLFNGPSSLNSAITTECDKDRTGDAMRCEVYDGC